MQIPEKMFKAYDIRGVYPDEISEENAVPITKAIYKFLTAEHGPERAFRFAIARDMRLSSPSLFKAISETLVGLGVEVIDLGLISTPSFYFAVNHFGYDGGLVITASHNPKQYNGLKIVKRESFGILKIGKSTGMEDIKKFALDQIDLPKLPGGKMYKNEDILEEEVENAIRIAGNPKIKPFKVVSDAANAMGAVYLEALFKKIPGELIKMNFELDGTFPVHQADPMQAETLVDLQKKIIDEGADLGLAPDGDGDRLFIIDEKGEIIPPSVITSLVARELLKSKHGEKIIVDVKYNLTAKENIHALGGEVVVSKTGHAFITEKLHETGGVFAGEASAHYFFREAGGGEAPMPVVLFVLSVMTRENKKLSEIAKELKKAHESGEINFAVENAGELIELIQKEYSDGDILTIDGVAIDYPTRRISLRSSNTEALLRLNVESLELETMEKTRDEIINLIQKHGKFDTKAQLH